MKFARIVGKKDLARAIGTSNNEGQRGSGEKRRRKETINKPKGKKNSDPGNMGWEKIKGKDVQIIRGCEGGGKGRVLMDRLTKKNSGLFRKKRKLQVIYSKRTNRSHQT